MADLTSGSANTVNQPAGNIKGNAPPTPPEIQELKSAEPISKLPDTNSAPTEATQAPKDQPAASVPEPAKDSAETGANGTAAVPSTQSKLNAPEADIGIPNEPLQPTSSTLQETEEKADPLAVQPEKPGESLLGATSADAGPSAAGTAETQEESKQLAKPVSVEEIQDPEGPTAKTDVANGTQETAESNMSLDKEVEEPVGTTQISQPEPSTAISAPAAKEPKAGEKRKATESATTNGDDNVEAKEVEAPAKKQKGSPIKNAINKVGAAVKKAGRPKKDKTEKKEPAPVGKTARRTRSQAKGDVV